MQFSRISLGVAVTVMANFSAAAGDPDAGAEAFRVCAACHSLAPGRHMTGPSLAGIWGRKAGSADGFTRYSPALAAADLVWSETTLDAWLADPQAVVSGNLMAFPGIEDARVREDLIAYLESATGGMMRGPELPDAKALGADRQVAAIAYCGDTYRVTTAAGEELAFWEFNLRFKTDSSDMGPHPGRPVLMPSGMMGDRAFVIFTDPAEISALIEKRC